MYTIYVEGLGYLTPGGFENNEYFLGWDLSVVTETAQKLNNQHNKRVVVTEIKEVVVLDKQLTFKDLNVGDRFVFCLDIWEEGNSHEYIKLKENYILCVKSIRREDLFISSKMDLSEDHKVKLIKEKSLDVLVTP